MAKQSGFDPTGRIGHEPLSAQAKLEHAERRAKRAKEQAEEVAKKKLVMSRLQNCLPRSGNPVRLQESITLIWFVRALPEKTFTR